MRPLFGIYLAKQIITAFGNFLCLGIYATFFIRANLLFRQPPFHPIHLRSKEKKSGNGVHGGCQKVGPKVAKFLDR